MRAVDLVIPDVQNRIEFVASIVSEIHEPIEEISVPEEVAVESSEVKIMRAGLRVSLNEALEEQEEAVRAQDFSLAATCKEKVDCINKKLEELNLNLKEKQAVKPAVEVVSFLFYFNLFLNAQWCFFIILRKPIKFLFLPYLFFYTYPSLNCLYF